MPCNRAVEAVTVLDKGRSRTVAVAGAVRVIAMPIHDFPSGRPQTSGFDGLAAC